MKRLKTNIVIAIASIIFPSILHSQEHEYIIKNVFAENSYYYTELRKIKNLIGYGKLEIRILSSYNHTPIKCNIYFKGHDNDSTLLLSSDSNGYIYVPISQIPNRFGTTDFEIKSITNGVYNGIEGSFNIHDTRKLTIILGRQGIGTTSIKSKNPIEPIRMIHLIDSLKKGYNPDTNSDISVKVYIKI
jgi:hypothetical protein